MRVISMIIAFLVFSVFFSPLSGDEKPKVGIEFKITERSYRNSFSKIITDIENEGGEKIRAILEKHLGYITFIEGKSSLTLNITLKNLGKSDSASSLKKSSFQILLTGTDIDPEKEKLNWTFQNVDDYNNQSFPTRDSFVTSFCASFENHISKKKDGVVNLLKEIPISKEALLCYYNNDPYFFIPVQVDDSGFGSLSEFAVFTEVVTPFNPKTPKEYKTRMEYLTGDTIDWSILNCPTQLKIEELDQKYCGGKIYSKAFWPMSELSRVQCGKNIEVIVIKYIPVLKKTEEERITSITEIIKHKETGR